MSWRDVHRSPGSSFGSNITDSKLCSKNGGPELILGSPNYTDRLGKVDSNHVRLILTKYGGSEEVDPAPEFFTIAEFLAAPGLFLPQEHALPEGTDLRRLGKDGELCRFRVETTFIPQGQLFVEAYNYQTISEDTPRNLLLMGNSQGSSVMQDHPGKNKLMLCSYEGPDHKLTWRYMAATRTNIEIGGNQVESDEKTDSVIDEGKAVAQEFGLAGMPHVMNCIVFVQIPLREQRVYRSLNISQSQLEDEPVFRSLGAMGGVGGSTVARMSIGSVCDDEGMPTKPVSATKLERDHTGPVTITLHLFYTLLEGSSEPSREDVLNALSVSDSIFETCGIHEKDENGQSVTSKSIFECKDMVSPMTEEQNEVVKDGILNNPFKPRPVKKLKGSQTMLPSGTSLS